MTGLWFAVGAVVVLVISWLSYRVARALGAEDAQRKSPAQHLNDAEMLTHTKRLG